MKKYLLIFTFLLPLFVFAKFFKGQIIYNDGSMSAVEVYLPIVAQKQKLTIRENNIRKVIDISEIKYLLVILNNNKEYLFKRGKLVNINNRKELKVRKNSNVLSLVNQMDDGIIISEEALNYSVKKVRGEETLIATYYGALVGLMLSKPDDEKLFTFYNSRSALKNIVDVTNDYLFYDCLNFAESINYKELDRKKSYIHQIVEIYNNCNKN